MMALSDFQTALGRLVGVQNEDPLHGLNLEPREGQCLEALQETDGFLFCRSIQRSWCIGRAAKSAQLTLSFLPETERQQLLDEWIDAGAGTQSFYDAQAQSFLEFISRRLENPSHQLSVCQFEQATLRAGEGTNTFITPVTTRLTEVDCRLRRGRYAALAEFHADPQQVFESLRKHEQLPPLSTELRSLLFAPGVPQLCYAPSEAELDIWDYLGTAHSAGDLTAEDNQRNTLEKLLRYGVIEYAD